MIHKIITKTIEHSTLLQNHRHHVDTSQISFIFTENISIVKVDTAEVNDMFG